MYQSAPLRRLLIVDPCDECQPLMAQLRDAGWQVDSGLLNTAHIGNYDLGLIRLMPHDLEQPEILKELITRSDTEWIAILSAEDLRRENVGDFVCDWFSDFHTSPFDSTLVQVSLGRGFAKARLRVQGAVFRSGPAHEMLGESRPIRELRRLLSKLAPTESPVLIRGEPGTGKELVARTLHLQSHRREQPFVAINCGMAPEHLLHGQLFGYEQGAFEGADEAKVGLIESANGGTLFLDEIGELPMDLQASLLRFLQDGHIQRLGGRETIAVDVRILAATHIDLEASIRKKCFREDLYYRLNVLQVGTAPLRERHGDLVLLANHFVHFYSQESGRRVRQFSQDALAAMGNHDWPGNVRELSNRVRRALVLAEGRQIEAADLGLLGESQVTSGMGTLDEYKSRAERQALCDVLTRHSDNLSVAAKVLGISRPTFYRLLHKHQIR